MKEYFKYDPEDIESLLLHKQFSELFDEEREFVLQHIGSAEEYDSLRQTLFHLQDTSDHEEWLEPDASIKKNLLAEFAREEKSGFKIWLNSLFHGLFPEWLRQPAFGVAFATALVAIVVVVVLNKHDNEEIHQPQFAEVSKEMPALDEDSVAESKRLFAENLTAQSLPPAPAEVVPAFAPAQDVSADEAKSSQVEEDMVSENEMATSAGEAFEQLSVATSKPSLQDNKTSADDAVSTKTVTAESRKKTSTPVEALESFEEIKTLSNVETVQSDSWTSQNNMTSPGGNYTINTELDSQAKFTLNDPDVAPIAEVRDVLELLFTAK
jgi:hypothetical protein